MSEQQTTRRTIVGTVVSDKMDKTAVILANRRVKHQRYGKYLTRSTKMHAHDPENQAREGDLVKIQESRPHSKTKSWELVEVLSKQAIL